MDRTVACVLLVLACGLGLGAAWAAEEAAWPEEGKPLPLPAAWKDVPPQHRNAARRVAKVDGMRLLAERIYGLRLDASTLVLDLALADDTVDGTLRVELFKGVKPTKERCTDYLTCELLCEVTLRETIEVIKRTIRRTKNPLGIKEETLESTTHETRDTVLKVVGSGAVPGSRGDRRIRAKRAAEMDAYRNLAETVVGVTLTSKTRVANLVLVSDEVAIHLAALLKGARSIKIDYLADDSCRVIMSVPYRELIETVRRTSERYVKNGKVTEKEWKNVEQHYETRMITAEGRGSAPKPGIRKPPIPPPPRNAGPFWEHTRIIKQTSRRVIKREIGAIP